jgi:4-amino-4-deoxy-L-arabinose transferase-like glycosyltransferase
MLLNTAPSGSAPAAAGRPAVPARPLASLLGQPGVCVFVLALLARLAGQLILGAYANPRTWEYEVIANNLLAGRGYTYQIDGATYVASQSSPLYIFLVAGVYLVTGHSQGVLLVLQALLGATTAALAAWLAWRMCSLVAAWCAGLLVAFDPGLVVYAAELHSLTLDALAFVALVCAVCFLPWQPKARQLALLGLLFGVATLTRSTALVLLPAALVWLLRYRGVRVVSGQAAALLGVALLVCAPWSLRNSILLGQPVLVSSEASEWLWRGNNPAATGSSYTLDGRRMLDAAPQDFQNRVYAAGEAERVRLYRDAALTFMREHPSNAAALYLRKLKAFWWSSDTTGLLYPPAWLSGYYLWSAAILLLAAVGAASVRRPETLLVLVFLLVSALTQSLFYVEGRHRLAIEPLILVLSALGAASVLRKYAKRPV